MHSHNLSFITWTRAISAMFILACHFCSQCENSIVAMLAHIFNIGVQLFFILSGFLVGYKGTSKPCGSWFVRRLKRIFLPYWLFLVVLAVVHAAVRINIFTKDWLFLWLGLQGSVVGVTGAGHTWFISALLICYALSPAIAYISRNVLSQENRYLKGVFVALISFMPVGYALVDAAWVYTLLTPVSIFTIACMYGMRYRESGCIRLQRKNIKWAIAIAVLSLCVRFVAHRFIDGTIWYDRVIVPYTHTISAFAIVAAMEAFVGNSRAPRIISFISGISFEIYLYHYMFIEGPITLFDATPNWLINCIFVLALAFPIAYLANRVYTFFTRGKI